MENKGFERRLAAILAADMVGYTRHMAADETGTLARLKALRAELIDPGIAEHRGRIVKVTGDGLLVEFASAVDAVQCAVELQLALGARNAELSGDERTEFRMGINVGDVIAEDGDIYGDGVNLASRLEGLAEAGGVYLSDDTHRQVRNKLDVAFEDLGERQVKNIAEPVRVYRVVLEPGGAAPAKAAGTGAAGIGAAGTGARIGVEFDKPSIAVLAFENLSGDPGQEYFSDGITEDIITALSRVRWFLVIARNSTFAFKGRAVDVREVARELGSRYVLEGSVRKAGNRVRITVQLSDGGTGKSVWAKRYDRELEDMFALQDEITETIVGAIEPELGKAERERARSKRPESLDAWDVYQQGMAHHYRFTKEDLAEARRLFQKAFELDPGLGAALAGWAETCYYEVVLGFADAPEERREEALRVARQAVELDDEDATARCALARAHVMRREHEQAIPELETALELNPSFAWAHYSLGAALVFTGRAHEAIPHLETAIRLSPRDLYMGSFLVRMADAHLFIGRYEDAVAWARKALRHPHFQWSRHAVLISALAHLGRDEEARRALDELMGLRPDFTLEFVRRTHLFTNPDDFARYLEGLRKAGVAE
ncbi:MAG: adenylate/guanylate cyclase domain-containing protein [Alphaproteobacteria bacterium]